LGYYARARQAHACARQLVGELQGSFPRTAQALERLPGVGASTAAAIAAFCFGERVAIFDANVQRVLARQYAVSGDAKRAQVRKTLWRHACALLPPARQIGLYTQAIMDLGAQICTAARPRCTQCPVSEQCLARQQNRVDQLPTPSRRSSRPVRRAHVLVALAGRAVFLEQRAASGIWGGLLSFPQFSTRKELVRAAAQLGASPPQTLATRKHSFTHFTLAFTPYLLHLPAKRRHAWAGPGRWLGLREVETAAVPAPVRSLLRELKQGEGAQHLPTRASRTRAAIHRA
ncbi:MAG TPA: NUDIX domain-containing protein, partial [Burkholderiaceae bacterium]|nr:NUDIX domain-containing protein [Burkholderiaceae bacterium]